jgi:hypothetical protein
MSNINNRLSRLEFFSAGNNRPPTLPEAWLRIDPETGLYVGPGPDDDPTLEELQEFEIEQSMLASVPFVGPLEGEPY